MAQVTLPFPKDGPKPSADGAVVVPSAAKPAVVPGVATGKLESAVVPENPTVLSDGVVIPSKKDMAAKPVDELKATYAAGVAALTKRLTDLGGSLPNIGFSGSAGQNLDAMYADRAGRDGGAWVAGMRSKPGSIGAYVSDLINSAADASAFCSLDRTAHRSGTYPLGGVVIMNLDKAADKGGQSRELSSKNPGGENAERLNVVLNKDNFDGAVAGVISWEKSPAGLSLRSQDKERADLVNKFRSLYVVSEAISKLSPPPS